MHEGVEGLYGRAGEGAGGAVGWPEGGRMSGAVGLRCANPTYAVCICVDHT